MKASVFVGTSLDGFLARVDGSFDFLSVAEGEPHGFVEFLATVDAIVMGRNTYEVVRAMSPWPYGTVPVFVLSTRPLSEPPAGVEIEHLEGAPADVLSTLAARGYTHAYIDGGLTVQSYLRAGLVTGLTVNRVPVLIGSGIPLFGALASDLVLTHVVTRVFESGAVQSEYRIGVR